MMEMTRVEVAIVAAEIEETAERLGWERERTRVASTGSRYIELCRMDGGKGEWVVVRVANHKKSRERWLTTLSWSPYELDEAMLYDLLAQPFGKVGDVFDLVT